MCLCRKKPRCQQKVLHSGKLTQQSKNGPSLEDVFPIEHVDISASYVSLPEGKLEILIEIKLSQNGICGWGFVSKVVMGFLEVPI